MKKRSTLADTCAELGATWINGNRSDVLAEISKPGRSHKRCIAVAVGTMRWLAAYHGDDAEADLAMAITKPFGGHF
jgi:hypothetical protein